MNYQFATDTLDIMAGAAVAACLVISTALTVAGVITYLLTREPAGASLAALDGIGTTQGASEKQTADHPMAIAG